MLRVKLLLFICIFLFVTQVSAQSDNYTGTWEMEFNPGNGAASVKLTLQIATSEKSILYPAQLTISSGEFSGEYELLLAKKNIRELGISTNKFPLSEKPFSLGNATTFLNGTFDFSKDIRGIPTLTAKRMELKQPVIKPDAKVSLTVVKPKITETTIREFLQMAEIVLKKINNTAWESADREKILNPALTPAYLGIKDTVHIRNRDGYITLSGGKNSENDIVTAALNGRVIVDGLELGKKKQTDDILIDTGYSILVFFTDVFGNKMPSKGKLNLDLNTKKINLDFATRADSASTFIVSKIFFDKDLDKETQFQTNSVMMPNGPLQKNEKQVANIVATSPHLTFAIWDDAAEDGDSISISINQNWLVQGFPVKKQPQFIDVTLKPGPNMITFIADNLGSIPPNTSILEIIEGKKRKSFSIETIMGEKNLIKIYYDVK